MAEIRPEGTNDEKNINNRGGLTSAGDEC